MKYFHRHSLMMFAVLTAVGNHRIFASSSGVRFVDDIVPRSKLHAMIDCEVDSIEKISNTLRNYLDAPDYKDNKVRARADIESLFKKLQRLRGQQSLIQILKLPIENEDGVKKTLISEAAGIYRDLDLFKLFLTYCPGFSKEDLSLMGDLRRKPDFIQAAGEYRQRDGVQLVINNAYEDSEENDYVQALVRIVESGVPAGVVIDLLTREVNTTAMRANMLKRVAMRVVSSRENSSERDPSGNLPTDVSLLSTSDLRELREQAGASSPDAKHERVAHEANSSTGVSLPVLIAAMGIAAGGSWFAARALAASQTK